MTSETGSTLKSMLLAGAVAAAVSVAIVGGFLLARSSGDATAVAGLSGQDKASIEETVRDYLIRNPEILIEMSGELEKRQAAAQETAVRNAIAANAGSIYRSEADFTVGNPNGDVTVVEFFDYNCSYCRRAMPDLVRLIENDPKVRVVLKEFPILRRESEGAARVALAAGKQGKYFELHRALFEANGLKSEEVALKLAADLGLDVDRLKADMNGADVTKTLEDARALAQRLGVQGTPFYLIGDRVLPGAPEDLYEQLVARVEDVRKNGCDPAVSC